MNPSRPAGSSDTGRPPTETPDRHGAFPRLKRRRSRRSRHTATAAPSRRARCCHARASRTRRSSSSSSGKVAVLQAYRTPDEEVVRVHGPGRFLGELGVLTGQVSFLTTVVAVAGEVLAVPVESCADWSPTTPGWATDPAGLPGPAALMIGLGAGFGSSVPASRRTPRGCWSSPAATGSRTGASTWRPTTRPNARCGALRVGPRDTPLVVCAAPAAAQPEQRRARRDDRDVAAGRRLDQLLRPAGRRRRPGRSGGGRLRRVRGAAHHGAGRRRGRWAGGDLVPHRELPRLPGRDLRLGAG